MRKLLSACSLLMLLAVPSAYAEALTFGPYKADLSTVGGGENDFMTMYVVKAAELGSLTATGATISEALRDYQNLMQLRGHDNDALNVLTELPQACGNVESVVLTGTTYQVKMRGFSGLVFTGPKARLEQELSDKEPGASIGITFIAGSTPTTKTILEAVYSCDGEGE